MKLQQLQTALKNSTSRVVLKAACNKFDRSKQMIIRQGTMTSVSAMLDMGEEWLDSPCGESGTVQFFGGPPGKTKWYSGSVLDYICDCVLTSEVKDDRNRKVVAWELS